MKTKCQCCDHVGPVEVARSSLKRGTSFNLCESCAAAKHEPRFWLILFARTNGVRAVEVKARSGLYCGREILLREVI